MDPLSPLKMLRIRSPPQQHDRRSSGHLSPLARRQALIPSTSAELSPEQSAASVLSFEQERASLLSAASIATTNPQATAVDDPRFASPVQSSSADPAQVTASVDPAATAAPTDSSSASMDWASATFDPLIFSSLLAPSPSDTLSSPYFSDPSGTATLAAVQTGASVTDSATGAGETAGSVDSQQAAAVPSSSSPPEGSDDLSTGAKVGIAVGALALVALLTFVLFRCFKRRSSSSTSSLASPATGSLRHFKRMPSTSEKEKHSSFIWPEIHPSSSVSRSKSIRPNAHQGVVLPAQARANGARRDLGDGESFGCAGAGEEFEGVDLGPRLHSLKRVPVPEMAQVHARGGSLAGAGGLSPILAGGSPSRNGSKKFSRFGGGGSGFDYKLHSADPFADPIPTNSPQLGLGLGVQRSPSLQSTYSSHTGAPQLPPVHTLAGGGHRNTFGVLPRKDYGAEPEPEYEREEDVGEGRMSPYPMSVDGFSSNGHGSKMGGLRVVNSADA